MGSVIIFTQIAPPVRMRNEHWQRKLSEDFVSSVLRLIHSPMTIHERNQ